MVVRQSEVPYWHQVPGRHVTDGATGGLGTKALERDMPVVPHQDPKGQSVMVDAGREPREAVPLNAASAGVVGRNPGLDTVALKERRGRAAVIILGFSSCSVASNLCPSARNLCRGCC